MTAEEKLTLMDWCRNAEALASLTTRRRPLKLIGEQSGAGLRAIWRPIPIASWLDRSPNKPDEKAPIIKYFKPASVPKLDSRL